MDTSSIKNAAFGGYDKKSVHDFLEELSLSYAVKLTEVAEEKGALMDKVAELEKTVAELKAALDSSEEEKNHVANAIVSAEKEAAKILATATSEAEAMKASAKEAAENLKETTRQELKGEFELLKDLRLSTLQAMNMYKEKLDAISKRLNGEE